MRRAQVAFLALAILGLGCLSSTAKRSSKIPSFNEEAIGEEDEETMKPQTVNPNTRSGKLFSLFNVVQFQNTGCRSQSTVSSAGTGATWRNGTCFTSSQCSSKGGSASGNCAAGFGVCCLFLVSASSSTITQNCTYIRNPGYPSAYSSSSSVTYTVKKCQNSICWIRLDFESFTIQGVGATRDTAAGNPCLDTFVATVNTGQSIPTICGQNTGQHIYLDIGNAASDTATLTFTFQGSPTTTTTSRSWEIKVSQIPCFGAGSSNDRPPPGCLQWNTGLTGRITTFNFIPTNDNHLSLQNYQICIRQEAGYCCVQYQVCSDTSSYTLDTQNVAAIARTSSIDSNCFVAATKDYITIAGASNTCIQGAAQLPVVNRLCGGVFNTFEITAASAISTGNAAVCDCTTPFVVGIYTTSLNDAGIAAAGAASTHGRGLCLNYMQIPCNT